MKMRDKKKKKVNRIVKAGLALLCAGALLGGAVFGGGSVRVKAEDDVKIKAIYYDGGVSYVYYIKQDEKRLSLDENNREKILDDDSVGIHPRMYIIDDSYKSVQSGVTTKNDIETQMNSVVHNKIGSSAFENQFADTDALYCYFYYNNQTYDYEYDYKEIDEGENSVSALVEEQQDLDESQLEGAVDKGIENIREGEKLNIFLILTDENEKRFPEIADKNALCYKVYVGSGQANENADYIEYKTSENNFWSDTINGELSRLSYIKIKGCVEEKYTGQYTLDGDDIEFECISDKNDDTETETSTEPKTEPKTEPTAGADGSKSERNKKTDPYVVNKFEIENDRIIVYITNNTDEELKESDVYAFLDGEKHSIKKDYSYKKDNVSKWIVQGKFIEATATDAPNVKLKLEIKGEPLYVGVKKAGIIDRFINWFNETLSHKIVLICGCLILVVLVVFIILIVRINKKRKQGKRRRQGGIPHGSPSSSPDVQLRSGVSPTAQTNVLARRAGEQNMQGMNNTVPANNTKQIQIQIIGRNPKIINTYINGSIFVGRANTCDVFINDATISRQHFALECVNGEVFIQPLVATNGTKLNGQRINDKHQLYPNDRIQIGTVGIVVRW